MIFSPATSSLDACIDLPTLLPTSGMDFVGTCSGSEGELVLLVIFADLAGAKLWILNLIPALHAIQDVILTTFTLRWILSSLRVKGLGPILFALIQQGHASLCDDLINLQYHLIYATCQGPSDLVGIPFVGNI